MQVANLEAVLIPSIDLQGGRVVQLVQGDKLAIASDELGRVDRKLRSFRKYQLNTISDAAMSPATTTSS